MGYVSGDVKTAFDALKKKKPMEDKLFHYYDGSQPLVYPRDDLKTLFKGMQWHFAENWCAVVVDAALDRMNITGFEYPDDDGPISKKLEELWQHNEMGTIGDDIHEAVLVTGEAYLIIWPDEDGYPNAYPNAPQMCHCQYDPDRPKEILWAAKQWLDIHGHMRMTLYYRDRLEYYVSNNKVQQDGDDAGEVFDAGAFRPAEIPVAENPYGVIPVFHFRTRRRALRSDIQDIMSLQDAVNKLLTDMMSVSEFGAFPIRYIISECDIGKLKAAPNEVWNIKPTMNNPNPTAGQFDAMDLHNYISPLDRVTASMGTISRTPKHYFGREAGQISGEALIALEAPLNKRISAHIKSLTGTWRRAMLFMLQIVGISPDEPYNLQPNYDEPTTVQPKTSAEMSAVRVQSGVPLLVALRMEGIDPGIIALVEEALEADAEKTSSFERDLMASAFAAKQGNEADTEDETEDE